MGGQTSCLDLAIISVSLTAFVSRVIVDSQRCFTPRRIIRNRSRTKTIFTDHYSVMVKLKGMPTKQQKENHEHAWNKGNPNGWEMYERMTDEKSDTIKAIVDNQDNDIEMVINKLDKIETKIKFKAFGKTKVKSKPKVVINKKTQHERDDDLKQKEADKISNKRRLGF